MPFTSEREIKEGLQFYKGDTTTEQYLLFSGRAVESQVASLLPWILGTFSLSGSALLLVTSSLRGSLLLGTKIASLLFELLPHVLSSSVTCVEKLCDLLVW